MSLLDGLNKLKQIKWGDKDHRGLFVNKLANKIRLQFFKHFNGFLYIIYPEIKFDHFNVNMNFFEGFNKNIVLSNPQIQNIQKAQIMEQAEKIINHQFNLLGSGEVELGSEINWHCDFKADYIWPPKYFQLFVTDDADQPKGVDIKVPWELSRLQHLLVLGQAHWLSGNEKYTEEFKAEIDSWFAQNPPEIGVNWVCSMEISLRAVSLICSYFFFRHSSILDKDFWNKYFTLLYYSGLHIEQNVEVDINGKRNNHYLANCVAMVWLGLFFGDYNKRTKKWLLYGKSNLCKEMDYQVNPDGGSFEGSLSYHRLALEMIFFTTILLRNNQIKLPDAYINRLEKMCEFTMHYTKPNGLAPQFGDADNGRFCVLSCYGIDDMLDHRNLLAIAGEYFKRNDFRKAAGNKCFDALWIFGKVQQSMNIDYPKMIKYPDTGFYIFRTNGVFVMIKCGSIGQKNNGGHDHNDQLSFELNIDGVDLIVDPGTYVYTMDKELRYLFRSTKYHNVSQVGSFEQNIIRKNSTQDVFSMYSFNKGVCTCIHNENEATLFFSGKIVYAGTNFENVRSFELRYIEREIYIYDDFYGIIGGQYNCTCRLHLANGVLVKRISETVVEVSFKHVCARIKAETPINIEIGMISPSYGVIQDAFILSWVFQKQTKLIINY